MRFAFYKNRKSEPEFSGQKGVCLDCGLCVVAKCGKINQWHWAHFVNNLDGKRCHYLEYSQNESQWHLDWKYEFPEKYNEVKIVKNGITKIADIYCNGKVVEFQKSDISEDEVCLRENHYEKLIWVVNGMERGSFIKKNKQNYYTYSWINRPKFFDNMTKPIFVDLGDCVFQIKKSHGVNGWGYVFDKKEFIKMLHNDLGVNVWD